MKHIGSDEQSGSQIQATENFDWLGVPRPPTPPKLKELLRRLRTPPGEVSTFLTRVKKFLVEDDRDQNFATMLFDRTAWGVIRWRRSLGKPVGPRMSDAFDIKHQYYLIVDGGVNSQGEVIDKSKWLDGATPVVSDGPNDEEYYRLTYMLQAASPWKNAIGVFIRTEVKWDLLTPPWMGPQRRIVYPESLENGLFDANRTGITYLEDIEVVRLLR